ncbi:MAG TPA: Hpt domain-containing protein [Acidimicrobiales bacterium]|nr:Hpt domain-containing protein [Acidimicrobiales bacterium]
MDAYVAKPVTLDALGDVLGSLVPAADPAVLDAHPSPRGALSAAVAAADLPEVARAAHRLKGSCAAVGATAMGAVVAAIEADAPEGRGEPLAGTVDHVERALVGIARRAREPVAPHGDARPV